jgi:hypothetical protein
MHNLKRVVLLIILGLLTEGTLGGLLRSPAWMRILGP